MSNCTKIVNLPIPFITIVKISINRTSGTIWLKFSRNIGYSLDWNTSLLFITENLRFRWGIFPCKRNRQQLLVGKVCQFC